MKPWNCAAYLRWRQQRLIMSHSLMCRYIVLITAGVDSSNHVVLYTIKSIWRGESKKLSLSVWPFVCYANKNAYDRFIIGIRIIIRISDERVWHPLQENKVIFSKKYIYFNNFTSNFRKINFFLTTFALLAVERYFAYQLRERGWLPLQDIKCNFWKKLVSRKLNIHIYTQTNLAGVRQRA